MIQNILTPKVYRQENPNQNATVAFVIFYPFQFYVYKNIYKHFDNAEFIVDLGAFYPKRQPVELEEQLIKFLKEKKVFYRVLEYSDYHYPEYLKLFFNRYKTLVGVWERGCHLLPCNFDKKQVNLTYGAGKELTQVRFSRRYHDLILTYGERDHKLFSLFTKAVIVGNPKFDDWFNNQIDYSSVQEVVKQCSPNKKTLLYLPTHSDLSSLNALTETLEEMTGKYNIIIKIHYFTSREEPETIKKLLAKNVCLVFDDADLLPLLTIADVVLSDNSSAIFDAVLADKPIVVTNFLSSEYLDIQHKKLRYYNRGSAGALTYSNSIEQVVKRDGTVITIKEPEELPGATEEALQDSQEYKEKRNVLRNSLFSFNDGTSGFRAAEEIKKLDTQTEEQEKPILFHAVEGYNSQLGKSYRLLEKRRTQELENYKLAFDVSATSTHTSSFLVMVLDGKGLRCVDTLLSLYYQDSPVSNIKIVVITTSKKDEFIKSFAGKHFEQKGFKEFFEKIVFFYNTTEKECGVIIANEVSKTQSDIVCFAYGGDILPSDWITLLSATYKNNPIIGGAGGYHQPLPENKSAFDSFFTMQIAKKFGIDFITNHQLYFYPICNSVWFQNPAGSLHAISYKRDVLEPLLDLFTDKELLVLEKEIKHNVLIQKPIAFIPSAVLTPERLTFKSFVIKNFYEGFSNEFLHTLYPRFGEQKQTLLRILLSLLSTRFGRGGFTSRGVFFVGFLSTWVGSAYYSFTKMRYTLNRVSGFFDRD